MADDDTGDAGTTTTFSQADVDRIVRERLAREREKFKDHDELRAKAAEADKNKSALEKLLEKVSGLETRAAEADARALRMEVAQAKGLTPGQAKRLQGSTREELEADADELKEAFKPADKGGEGADVDSGKDGEPGKGGAGTKETTGSGSGQGNAGGSGGSDGRTLPPSGRPKEKLTSGAVPTTSGDKSPAELAESILKNGF